MSRLSIKQESRAQTVVEGLYKDMERRISASPSGICPVDTTSAFLKMCMTQSCGKCTPCRVGLFQLDQLMDMVLDGTATVDTLHIIHTTATAIANSADCAIGAEAGKMVLRSLDGCYDDYMAHIKSQSCKAKLDMSIPCVANCPADVDIPGYIALVGEKRYADAVRLIRKDNPFPVACALICEHPCEARCRRTLMDAPINIRGMKRAAIDGAGIVPPPERMAVTGKEVAVIGGGPSGLTAAYYLQLMGHQVTVFEQRSSLGGMLRYGIPAYRLPREMLQQDIDCILSLGVKVQLNTRIGTGAGEISMEERQERYNAVYSSIGAHKDKKLDVEGEEAEGVMSAVELLGKIGDNCYPDFRGKRVCVIGGGNVAMDCTRSAIRAGADKVMCVYRRRIEDMTALPEEIQGAQAEGAEIVELHAPLRIETDSSNKVTALWTDPKQIGIIKGGRPSPVDSGKEPERIPCDIIIVAIGQAIDADPFAEAGMPVNRGTIKAALWTAIEGVEGVFAGGDCVTGPATAIRAIAAGKVAAANIDNYLGYNHTITLNVDIPEPNLKDRDYCGRINMEERPADERKHDFKLMELPLTEKAACQEAGRCLRCDHFGCGIFKGGRKQEW
ncbi:MAG: FAD-dependent oxidoreductase [Oscillospiraceae bacterium]|nr:FAD-dependent oxidoreductase [Oscillospiraceae bacterium]